jgi:exodeoxyribonuclease-3
MNVLKILSWNVNGLRAVYRKGFLKWFNKEEPHILCLQETRVDKKQLPQKLIDVEGYHSFFVSAEKKGYSGVAQYSKIEPLDVEKGFGIEKFDREGRILISNYDDFVLFNIYFPNGKMSEERLQYKMDFYDTFLEYVNRVRDKGKNIVICGDVNTAHKEIDLARPKENEKISGFLPEEREWIDKLIAEGYVDTFRHFNKKPEQYTWWDYKTKARDRNVGWRIDYFFVSENFIKSVKDSFILSDVMGSDHCPIGIKIEIKG